MMMGGILSSGTGVSAREVNWSPARLVLVTVTARTARHTPFCCEHWLSCVHQRSPSGHLRA